MDDISGATVDAPRELRMSRSGSGRKARPMVLMSSPSISAAAGFRGPHHLLGRDCRRHPAFSSTDSNCGALIEPIPTMYTHDAPPHRARLAFDDDSESSDSIAQLPPMTLGKVG
jgi:hypothetical protein